MNMLSATFTTRLEMIQLDVSQQHKTDKRFILILDHFFQ